MSALVPAAWLIPLDRKEAGQVRYAVPESGALIGRKDNCTIKLATPTISGEQCLIRKNKRVRHGIHLELEDKSSNGTYLNGKLIGKGNVSGLSNGDIIRLSRRDIPELQFRFEYADAATPAAAKGEDEALPRKRSAPPESSVLPPQQKAPAQQSAQRDLQKARLRLAEEGQQVRALAAQVRQAQAELEASRSVPQSTGLLGCAAQPQPRLRPIGSAEGLRAAEDEVLLEAERGRLMTQRAVLEAELAERKAANEQLERDLAQAEAATDRARSEHSQLIEEHDRTARRLVDVVGKIEGHNEFMPELEQSMSTVLEELASARSVTSTLEVQLKAAQAELANMRASEEAIERKAKKVEAAFASVQQLGRSLADGMREEASVLSKSIDGASTGGSCSSSSEPPVQNVQPSSNVRGSSPAGARRPLTERSCKENMVPAEPSAQQGVASSGSRPLQELCGSLFRAQTHSGTMAPRTAAGATTVEDDTVQVVSSCASPSRKRQRLWSSGVPNTRSSARHSPRRSASGPCAASTAPSTRPGVVPGAAPRGAVARAMEPPAWEAMHGADVEPDLIEDLCSSID